MKKFEWKYNSSEKCWEIESNKDIYVKRIPGTSTAHYDPPGLSKSSCHSACKHNN